jgi:hypothetical protein
VSTPETTPRRCPRCSSENNAVIESKRSQQGRRRQRIQCAVCEHRWTEYPDGSPRASRRSKAIQHPLSTDDVRWVLQAYHLDHAAAGRYLSPQRNRETIRQVRVGILYRDVVPQLPRWRPRQNNTNGGLSCAHCKHWLGERCGFDHPDPLAEGLVFANECLHYAAALGKVTAA